MANSFETHTRTQFLSNTARAYARPSELNLRSQSPSCVWSAKRTKPSAISDIYPDLACLALAGTWRVFHGGHAVLLHGGLDCPCFMKKHSAQDIGIGSQNA